MMNKLIGWQRAAMASAALFVLPAGAQAPGEDPVILKGKLSIQMQPTNPPPKSGNIESKAGMPAATRARVARYEAKSFSADTTGIATDSDAVNAATAEGMHKTCVQEVGSNTVANPTPGTKYGPNQAPQIVVLRGDLVNICR
ncbi:hypothetical protein HNE04_08975 [Caenimonas sp. S4]|nr:hypothetical protein [Caenimonas soli]